MSLFSLTRSLFSIAGNVRSFSSTPVNLAGYKLKTHTGTKKRWSTIANGMFKRGKCGKRHLNTHMPASKINALGGTVISTRTQAKHLRRLLPGS
ncbi:ribosomal l35 domain-containing protein [Rhizoctonia solani AG-1 IA]|uniref:Ribosomal l35 domain-containing protein n=1 Tax=Thanatephorus cucumeris (strain AG1-IA) TaxID=983506 RepID=L8WLB4_THACA|nr:ribosomal l35 domain-containing protein [Rhizoctonia solani AG-1 IA]